LKKSPKTFWEKLRFSESALEIFVFLNQLLKTAFFLTALGNFVFLNRLQVIPFSFLTALGYCASLNQT
ncbi:MAG: hypothetical protein RR499_05420, partial [Mucinivorans sp.]